MVRASCRFVDGTGGTAAELLILNGPTMQVDVGFDANFGKGARPQGAALVQGVHALVDTGATDSCIDSILAATLGLPIVNRRTVSGTAGEHWVNVHLAQVYIPALDKTLYGRFAGVHLRAGGQVHSVLLGRTYNGPTGAVEIDGD